MMREIQTWGRRHWLRGALKRGALSLVCALQVGLWGEHGFASSNVVGGVHTYRHTLNRCCSDRDSGEEG